MVDFVCLDLIHLF